jgi:hypothetical protein
MSRQHENETPGSNWWFAARCDEGVCQHEGHAKNLPHAIYAQVPVEVLAGCVNKACKVGLYNCLDDDLKSRVVVCERTGFPAHCGTAPPSGTTRCHLCKKTGKI